MIGIISDIQVNLPALQAVLKELDSLKVSKILCLGDICGYYCFVNEVIDEIRSKGIFCLKGNHDAYILGECKCPRSTTVNRCISYQQTIIREDNLSWVRTLKSSAKIGDIWAVHGGWNDHLDEYVDKFDFNSPVILGSGCKVFLSGHSHIQNVQTDQNITYCNPGSVGQPRDNDPRAAYALLKDDGQIELRRTEYDIDLTARAMEKAGFERYVYANLYKGTRITRSIPKR